MTTPMNTERFKDAEYSQKSLRVEGSNVYVDSLFFKVEDGGATHMNEHEVRRLRDYLNEFLGESAKPSAGTVVVNVVPSFDGLEDSIRDGVKLALANVAADL